MSNGSTEQQMVLFEAGQIEVVMCSNPYAWATFLHSVEDELWPIVCVAKQGYAVAGEVGFGEIREFSNSDGNENIKKAIVLIIKTTTLNVH